ncbi:MAG: glycerophosphodiester phosphodiesterase [Gammaproteobacteria bacterium]|nr:glycerophosphodiester phosphodiesterase [Gammaproteobacteria bacterium]
MHHSAEQPSIIAHRGACAYLPEHSRGAKALAYAMGADFLEQDVIATRDGELVVLHDLFLDAVCDVREQFAGRARADGLHYCFDFDLAELRTLRFHERIDLASGLARYPRRYPPDVGRFGITTLAEEIAFAESLNRSTGRNVGIYPEIKNPEWHLGQGFDLGAAVVDALLAVGSGDGERRIYLQCFDAETLRAARARAGASLPIIQLVGSAMPADRDALSEIAHYADGIGPSLKHILSASDERGGAVPSDLVADAHALGLVVHPYTHRDDDLPTGVASSEALLEILFGRLGADGVFTDFTDIVNRYLARE